MTERTDRDVARWAVENELSTTLRIRRGDRVVGRARLVEPDDLRHAAIAAVLAHPGVGEAYARAVARRTIRRAAARAAAVPTIPTRAQDGRPWADRVLVDVLDGFVAFASPEAELLAAEAAVARREARRRARRAIAAVLRGLRAWEVRAVRRLWGLDGDPPGRPRAVARALRRPVGDLYDLQKRLRRRLLASAAARNAHDQASEARMEDPT